MMKRRKSVIRNLICILMPFSNRKRLNEISWRIMILHRVTGDVFRAKSPDTWIFFQVDLSNKQKTSRFRENETNLLDTTCFR